MPFKRCQHLGRGAGLRNNGMDFVCRTYKCRAYMTEFAGVGNNDDLLGMLDHLTADECLIDLQSSCSSIRIEAGNTQEDLVHVEIVEGFQRSIAGDRK